MAPSPEFIDEWTNIEAEMAEMLTTHKDQCTANTATAITRAHALLDDLASQSDRLHTSSRTITDSISTSIQNERIALSNESNELSQQISRVTSLEQQVASLEQSHVSLTARRRSAEEAIPLHAAVASEEIDEIKEIESKHIKRLKKNKHELSLHALMTNIKWDYNRLDVLAGEVSVPSKCVHRKFEIEKGELSEFEIAERLWGMIEG
ncbi:hypothetical protein ACHAXR_002050 [Thalassiosira sp. AJA248-18]